MSWSTRLIIKNTDGAADKVREHFDKILNYESANDNEVALKDKVADTIIDALAASDPGIVYDVFASGSCSWGPVGSGSNHHSVQLNIQPIFSRVIE